MEPADYKPTPEPGKAVRLKPWHWVLLIIQYVGLLVPGIYARATPELFGFPFFYWYQFAFVLLSSTLTGIVYWRTRS